MNRRERKRRKRLAARRHAQTVANRLLGQVKRPLTVPFLWSTNVSTWVEDDDAILDRRTR
jgi:hypothetical protein